MLMCRLSFGVFQVVSVKTLRKSGKLSSRSWVWNVVLSIRLLLRATLIQPTLRRQVGEEEMARPFTGVVADFITSTTPTSTELVVIRPLGLGLSQVLQAKPSCSSAHLRWCSLPSLPIWLINTFQVGQHITTVPLGIVLIRYKPLVRALAVDGLEVELHRTERLLSGISWVELVVRLRELQEGFQL